MEGSSIGPTVTVGLPSTNERSQYYAHELTKTVAMNCPGGERIANRPQIRKIPTNPLCLALHVRHRHGLRTDPLSSSALG